MAIQIRYIHYISEGDSNNIRIPFLLILWLSISYRNRVSLFPFYASANKWITHYNIDMEYNLNRFAEAQDNVYEQVAKELRQGRKTSHWMWYIFPQIKGLGHSSTATYYAIRSLDEATQYLNHPVVGKRLLECCQILLGLENKTAEDILGNVDAMKLKSSMTLFSLVSDNPVFNQVIAKYFHGIKDSATLKIVQQLSRSGL